MVSARFLGLGVALSALSALAGPVRAGEAQRPSEPAASVPVPLPPGAGVKTEVDLRPEIEKLGLAIRDQGRRGTCSVFATTFLLEYHAAQTTGTRNLDFSEEYLNWAKNRANKTDFDGGMFTDIIRGYQAFGMVPATAMGYQARFDPKHPDAPAKPVIAAGRQSRRYAFTFLKKWDNQKGMSEKELEATLAALQAGRPVATGIWWLKKFRTVTVERVPLLKEYPREDNHNSDPSKNPMFDGHTIDLVGYHRDKAFPGGGYFIFRNSFGPAFGDAGYGYVSFRYLRDYANDAILIEADD